MCRPLSMGEVYRDKWPSHCPLWPPGWPHSKDGFCRRIHKCQGLGMRGRTQQHLLVFQNSSAQKCLLRTGSGLAVVSSLACSWQCQCVDLLLWACLKHYTCIRWRSRWDRAGDMCIERNWRWCWRTLCLLPNKECSVRTPSCPVGRICTRRFWVDADTFHLVVSTIGNVSWCMWSGCACTCTWNMLHMCVIWLCMLVYMKHAMEVIWCLNYNATT